MEPGLAELYDDRYGYPGKFALKACAQCGHRFIQAPFNPEQIKNLYTEYYPRASLESREAAKKYRVPDLGSFECWLNGTKSAAFYWVAPKSRVLDIGCGAGQSLVYLKHLGCNAEGVEADSNVSAGALEMGLSVRIGVFDPRFYSSHCFDFVTLSQVFEHVTNPEQTLIGIQKIMAPGGKVILSIPNAAGWGARLFGAHWIHWHIPYHLHFYSRKSLAILATKAGFRLATIWTLSPSEWLSYQWSHLEFYPKPGEPSVFWSPKEPLRFNAQQKVISKALRVLHRLKFNHLVTRIMDALGMGDNLLVILERADSNSFGKLEI